MGPGLKLDEKLPRSSKLQEEVWEEKQRLLQATSIVNDHLLLWLLLLLVLLCKLDLDLSKALL